MPRPNALASRWLAALAAAFALAVFFAPRDARAQGLVVNLPYLGPTSYSFTDTTLLTYRHDNFDQNQFDDRFLALTERYDSALSAAPWRFELRIDAFAPMFTRPVPSATNPWNGPHGVQTSCTLPYCTDYLRGDLRVERVALRYQRGPITAEIGDYYFVIGRGVALAFRKVDPLGLDTTLRGARFEVDSDRVTVRGFGGYANPQNLDPITLQVNHDWGYAVAGGDSTLRPGPDILGGGEAAARLGADQDVEIGLHAFRLHASAATTSDDDVDVFGYRAQAPALLDGRLALHAEVDGLRRTVTRYSAMGMERGMQTGSTQDFGRAVFGAAQLRFGNFDTLFEWKDYTNYLVSPDGSATDPRRVYSAAPSLERDDVILRSNSDTRGGRARVEYLFRPGPWSASITTLLAGSSELSGEDPWGPHGFGQAHVYLTLRRRPRAHGAPDTSGGGTAPVGAAGMGAIGSGQRVGSGEWAMTASAGFRHEWKLGPPNMPVGGSPTSDDWQTWHADMDLAFALGPDDSIEMRIDGRIERRFYGFAPESHGPGFIIYTRDGISLTWAHGDRLQLSGVFRYDNFFESQGRQTDFIDGSGNEFLAPYPVLYPAGEIRYMFYPGSTIRLFGGMTPGGRLCTGGVCRDVPPFQGALLELVLRI